jgi:predicted TIM-barrel fold metal-dependent hydrolase
LRQTCGKDPQTDRPTDHPVVWDHHCHLAGVAGETPEARMAKLLEYADRMRIDRLVLFMGWPFSPDPAPHEMRRQNDQVLEAIRRWPERALAYAYVNPKHVQASLDEMNRLIAGGPMVGIKLWIAERCHARALDPIVHLATKFRAVIYQHTWLKTGGNLPGESTPEDLVELARRHPQATFICGHAGGNWEHGIRTIRAVKHICLEIAGGDPMAGLVEMAVRELGAERVIYGSDVAGRSFASQLAKVLGADIPRDAKQQILAGNLRRLLGPRL